MHSELDIHCGDVYPQTRARTRPGGRPMEGETRRTFVVRPIGVPANGVVAPPTFVGVRSAGAAYCHRP
jgi:hypothetical protein